MGDLEQVEVTPGAFPGCFPAPCGNTAVGGQGCGGWAINPRNVLWPGLQPSPCQAELSHSPEMQLHFGNPFSELVLLLLFLLKHSHGIFLIVQPWGPAAQQGWPSAPSLWSSKGDYSLGWQFQLCWMDLWLRLNFLSCSSANPLVNPTLDFPTLSMGFSSPTGRILGFLRADGWLPSLLPSLLPAPSLGRSIQHQTGVGWTS